MKNSDGLDILCGFLILVWLAVSVFAVITTGILSSGKGQRKDVKAKAKT